MRSHPSYSITNSTMTKKAANSVAICPLSKLILSSALVMPPRPGPAAISTKFSTPSASTNSTHCSYETAPSQYSFSLTSSESDYLNPSEFEVDGSVNSSLYSAQAFISSADTDRLPYIPPLNLTEAHRTMELNPNFLADNYSTTVQQLESVTCVDPSALSVGPVHVISDSESKEQMKAQMARFKKPFKCPLCLFSESVTSVARDFIYY